jgi:hypothetical protein
MLVYDLLGKEYKTYKLFSVEEMNNNVIFYKLTFQSNINLENENRLDQIGIETNPTSDYSLKVEYYAIPGMMIY